MSNIEIIPPGTVRGLTAGGGTARLPIQPDTPVVRAGNVPVGGNVAPDTLRTVTVAGFTPAGASPGPIHLQVGDTRLVIDVVPQVILNTHSFVPAVGTPIFSTQAISFVVQPNTGNLTPFVLKVDFIKPVMWEVAFDSFSFSPRYEGSTAVRDGSVWRLTVVRKGGWPSSPTFVPIPVANLEVK